MKTIYIDKDFKCHITNDGTMTAVETDFFEGNCDAFIEGHRFIPSNGSWSRSDGVNFKGKMFTPFKPYNQLAAAQAQYEADLAEAAAAYQEGVDSAYDQ